MALQVKFGRGTVVPASLANGRKQSVITPGGYRPYEGSVANLPIDLDAPTKAQHDLKADLSAVVRIANVNQSVDGEKTFVKIVSTDVAPTANQHLTNKLYVDTGLAALQTQLDNISTTIASGLKYKGTLDASANPNYPAAAVGDVYLISVAGKIGGASGIDVEVGDMIICKVASAAGTHAAVGANWTSVQNNIGYATATIAGYLMLALPSEVVTGSNNTKAATPLGVETAIEAKAIRYDKAQALTAPQKAQAQANLGVEAAFSKGNIIQGTGVTLTGTLTNRLVGAGDVNVGINQTYLDARYYNVADNETLQGGTTWSRGTANTTAFAWGYKPTDFGAGKPEFGFRKMATADLFDMYISDGVNNNGRLNFSMSDLTKNNIPIATTTDITNALASYAIEYVEDTWT